MKPLKRIPLAGACLILATLNGPAGAQTLWFGDPPQPPTDVSHLPRRGKLISVTGGFTVNPASREEVRSFYNAVYTSSDNVPMESTANVQACVPGMNSGEFDRAVLRRINWLRAFAGLPASVSFAETNSLKNRQAALMMSRNSALSHFPPPAWLCYTADGADAAQNSNLALGSAGPDAITGYIWDHGANNTLVGHRRWMFYPQTQIMGTGDVPGQGGLYEANATWVFDGHYFDPRPAPRTPYVSWPPPGYVPRTLAFPRWSFGYPNANFTNATITMRSNGVPIAVSKHSYAAGFGENTVVWVPLGLNANDQNVMMPFNGVDTVYSVAISNILGMPQSWYTYNVTLFDPAVPGLDYSPTTISGPAQANVGSGNPYSVNPAPNASSYQWRSTLRTPFSLNDGAEAGLANFTTNTTPGYEVRVSSPRDTGSWAFRLAHPDTPAEELLTLNGILMPRTNTSLTFRSRMTWATGQEFAKVQVSTNSGRSWLDLYNQAGTSGPGESGFNTRSVGLGNFAGASVLLRFNYVAAGSIFSPFEPGDGWFLDNIAIANADMASQVVTNSSATTNFTFNPSQPGYYNLEARALIFTEFPLDWGPARQITAAAGGTPVIRLSQPLLTNNQVWIHFAVQSGSAATFKLLQASQPQGPWTTNTSATLTTNTPGASYRYTTTPSGSVRFYRVQTP